MGHNAQNLSTDEHSLFMALRLGYCYL